MQHIYKIINKQYIHINTTLFNGKKTTTFLMTNHKVTCTAQETKLSGSIHSQALLRIEQTREYLVITKHILLHSDKSYKH